MMKRWLVFVWIVSLLMVAGCGVGMNSFTGGSIPAGKGMFEGGVFDENQLPVVDAEVKLTPLVGELRKTRTDVEGKFSFPLVTMGPVMVTVSPKDGSTLMPRILAIDIESGQVHHTAILMRKVGDEPAFVESLAVSPASPKVSLKTEQQFTIIPAALRHPTWLVVGDVGRINAKGVFRAEKIGKGKVIAILGQKRATADVEVVP